MTKLIGRMWCEKCHKEVYVYGVFGELEHYLPTGYGELIESVCYGSFSPLPPELPDNWIDTVSEPSPDELEEMDINGRILLNDLVDAMVNVE